MTPYLDAGFLLTLLVPTDGSTLANQLLERFLPPITLSALHQLQAENLLISLKKSNDIRRRAIGLTGYRIGHHLLGEGVFQVGGTDWDQAFHLAVAWNRQSRASHFRSSSCIRLWPQLLARRPS